MRTITSARAVLSASLLAAIAFAALADPEPCPRCQEPENAGLCHNEKCQAQVLPGLRENALKRDTHSGHFYDPAPALQPRTEATDHAVRMARQADAHAARLGRTIAAGTPRRMTRGPTGRRRVAA